MKKSILGLALMSLFLLMTGCGGAVGQSSAAKPAPVAVAERPAAAEKYATRKLTQGTKVNLIVGKTIIPATLNDTKSAKELISRLPYEVKLNKYSHDYCGVMEKPLSYDQADVHNGWQNGDIDFATDGNYFTILYKDEDISKQFGFQVNMGVINAPLAVMDTLPQDITLRIELAK